MDNRIVVDVASLPLPAGDFVARRWPSTKYFHGEDFIFKFEGKEIIGLDRQIGIWFHPGKKNYLLAVTGFKNDTYCEDLTVCPGCGGRHGYFPYPEA